MSDEVNRPAWSEFCDACSSKPLAPDPTVDQQWTRFVRQWRDLMCNLFLPHCSRSIDTCCEFECANVAEHFARTGDIP